MSCMELRSPEQAKFSQAVKKRDGACYLTGETHPEVLEAAHLNPYAVCKRERDAFSPANGITMRVDLHRLFDASEFVLFPTGRDREVKLHVLTLEAAKYLSGISAQLKNEYTLSIPKECIPYLYKRYHIRGPVDP